MGSKVPPQPTRELSTTLTQLALNKLYPDSCPVSLSHLSTIEIALYTTILSRRPSLKTPTTELHESYRRRTSAIITSLSPRLLNPVKGALSSLPQSYLVSLFHNNQSSTQAHLPRASPLCQLHHRLNAQVIADILGALEMEVEDFLPEMLTHASKHEMSPALISALTAAEDFCATFMVPQEFAHWYQRAPPQYWAHVPIGEEGCDACRLARVAGHGELLIGLRAVMLSRMPGSVLRGEARSPRLEWIQGWMRTWGQEGTEMLFRSGRLGEELKALAGAGGYGVGDELEDEADITDGKEGTARCLTNRMTELSLFNESSMLRLGTAESPLINFEPAMASSILLHDAAAGATAEADMNPPKTSNLAFNNASCSSHMHTVQSPPSSLPPPPPPPAPNTINPLHTLATSRHLLHSSYKPTAPTATTSKARTSTITLPTPISASMMPSIPSLPPTPTTLALRGLALKFSLPPPKTPPGKPLPPVPEARMWW